MNWLQEITLLSPFVQGIFVIVFSAVLATVFKWTQVAILRRIALLARRTPTQLDDLAVTAFGRTNHFLLFLMTLAFVILWMDPNASWRHAALILLRLAFVIQIFLWLDGAVNFLIEARIRKKGQVRTGAMDLLRGVSRMFLLSLTLIACLDIFGVNITALVAGLGIGGVAVALAMQNILSDLFASLSIVLDKPFEVGDFIIAGEELGTVERIGLKTTRVRSLSGEQLIFPNSNLLQSRLRNYRRMNERRVVFQFHVDYGTTPQQLQAIPGFIRKAIERQSELRFDRAHLAGFVDAGYRFETVFWVKSPDYNIYMDLQQKVFFELLEDLAKSNVGVGVTGRRQVDVTFGGLSMRPDGSPSSEGPRVD